MKDNRTKNSPLEVNHQNRRQLRYVQFLDGIARRFAAGTVPATDPFAIEIHFHAILDRAAFTVLGQLKTQIGEALVGGALTVADRALNGALDLTVEKLHDVALFALDELQPRFFGRTQLDAWNDLYWRGTSKKTRFFQEHEAKLITLSTK